MHGALHAGPVGLEPSARRALGASATWFLPWLAFACVRACDLATILAGFVVVLGAASCSRAIDPRSQRDKRGGDRWSEPLVSACLLGALFAGAEPHGVHPARILAIAAIALAYALRRAAMRANPFFSGRLVIQTDRAHAVIRGGPYRFIRHPGNASLVFVFAFLPIAFPSSAVLALSAIGIALLLRRTRREDAFLFGELAGYGAYASRVRFRLIPGVY